MKTLTIDNKKIMDFNIAIIASQVVDSTSSYAGPGAEHRLEQVQHSGNREDCSLWRQQCTHFHQH